MPENVEPFAAAAAGKHATDAVLTGRNVPQISSIKMTHVQRCWTARDVLRTDPNVKRNSIDDLKTWLANHPLLPKCVSDEQIILFIHSCYYDVELAKKCIEDYYRLRLKVPQFFENRDISASGLEKALKVLHFAILPKKTPENYRVVFHKLNDGDPANYVFNDGFKLLTMMIDAVYIKEGPLPGLLILFDLNQVKLGHITKLPLSSVRKCLEYIQDAIPIRLKGIHVLNVNPIIDKIMLMLKPFLRKSFLGLLHFYKENDKEIYRAIPKDCLPKNYGGELESVEYYHERFVEEMKIMSPLFIEEELLFKKKNKAKLFGKPKNLDID